MLNDYTISMYLRLSSEDENVGESNSIKNQRDLLTQYISKHPELSKCRCIEHFDDGYSGVNFNRPAVTQMLQKVRNGEINCIVVKDFSRFGRNYIEIGDYLEQVFPFLGIRFISVNDHYDSDSKNGTIGDIEVALRTLIYDLYSKDLSVKVKSGRIAKMKRGEFISPYAPYGFKKSSTNKNRLEVDVNAAKIVRYIFELAISGKSAYEIVKILNDEKIPSPNEYKALNNRGRDWAWVSNTGTIWDDGYIKKMLADERYIGSAVGHMTERVAVGNPAIKSIPREEWIVVPNKHEAIVPKEIFEKVNQKHSNRTTKKSKPLNLFIRKIRCHYCNRTMERHKSKNPFYACRTPKLAQSPNCFCGNISEQMIIDIVLSAIQTQARFFGKAEKIRRKKQLSMDCQLNDIRQSIRQFEETIEKLNVAKQEHYEKYKDGKIVKDEYMFMRETCNKQIDETTENIAELTEKLNKAATLATQKTATHNEWQNCVDISELNREIVDTLVESIIVYDSERIEIVWKFADECLS